MGRPPVRPRARAADKSSLSALADQFALEFGQRREQIEHEPPLRVGGVDRIVQAEQADLALHQVARQFDQVLERAAQAVDLPDDEHIARPHLPQQLVEGRPRTLRPAGHVLKDALATGRLEGVHLQGWILIARRDARVADLHPRGPQNLSCPDDIEL